MSICSVDGKQKSYCTPEAYRGTTFMAVSQQEERHLEDVTAKARLFDTTSKSLGVTLIDYDLDPWPDVFVANDTGAEQAVSEQRQRNVHGVGPARRAGVQ